MKCFRKINVSLHLFSILIILLLMITNCEAQIVKGEKTDSIDNRFFVLLEYFSLKPLERLDFAIQFFKQDFQDPELVFLMKYDLDGLSGIETDNFLGVGHTGPNIINGTKFTDAVNKWNFCLKNESYLTNTDSLAYPILASLDEISVYKLLISYSQNPVSARIQFAQALSTTNPYNLLLIKLIKVDLDRLTNNYNPEVIDENFIYFNLRVWDYCIEKWKKGPN